MKNYKLAIVGATGLVGRTALRVLEEKNIFYTKDFINDSYYITLYKDITQKQVIDNININNENDLKQLLNIYLDKASTYQYTFEKKNNHYVFQNIKKI